MQRIGLVKCLSQRICKQCLSNHVKLWNMPTSILEQLILVFVTYLSPTGRVLRNSSVFLDKPVAVPVSLECHGRRDRPAQPSLLA